MYKKPHHLNGDKRLYSPTFTDSTDEPTPMGLFKQGKGFKFPTMNNMDDAGDYDSDDGAIGEMNEESIGFGETSNNQ